MNYMIDLETLSTQPNARIIQIGICKFTRDKVIDGGLNMTVYDKLGHIDQATVEWWVTQAQKGIAFPIGTCGTELAAALEKVLCFMGGGILKPTDTVWGHPAAFDVLILQQAFYREKVPCPWHYKQARCCMTMKHVPGAEGAKRPFPKNQHDALSDAQAQAQWMINIRKELTG